MFNHWLVHQIYTSWNLAQLMYLCFTHIIIVIMELVVMAIASIEPAQNYYVARKICVTSWEDLLALNFIPIKSFMLSIHMCEKMHMYFGVRILHSLRVCQIVHWVMGTTGKIPAAGSLLSKERQYGMPNLAHIVFFCLFTCLVVSYLVWVFVQCTQKSWGRRIYTQNF